MSYKVEFIHKKSVFEDIVDSWQGMGTEIDSCDGFVFFSDARPIVRDGVIILERSGHMYVYNLSDFYRVKLLKQLK